MMIRNDELSRIAEAEFKDLNTIEKAIHLLYCDVDGYEEYANDAAAQYAALKAERSEYKDLLKQALDELRIVDSAIADGGPNVPENIYVSYELTERIEAALKGQPK